jgi:cytochrome c
MQGLPCCGTRCAAGRWAGGERRGWLGGRFARLFQLLAMKAAGEKGLVWNGENLGKFIAYPKAMASGTRMVFPGLKNAQERADVIAYLKTQTRQ